MKKKKRFKRKGKERKNQKQEQTCIEKPGIA
jgi:hypothetical protein